MMYFGFVRRNKPFQSQFVPGHGRQAVTLPETGCVRRAKADSTATIRTGRVLIPAGNFSQRPSTKYPAASLSVLNAVGEKCGLNPILFT